MKADYWRRGVATIMTAGLLAVGAAAQDGAEGEVNITEAAPTATSEAAPEKPAAKPIKPQITERDPFVNQLTTGTVIGGSAPSRAARVKPAAAASSGDSGKAVASSGKTIENQEVEEIPAPEVKVTGIVMSGSGNQAIISTDVGTRMISTGQKLGDYKVSSISNKKVVFSYGGDKFFDVPLEPEFGQ